MNANNFLVVEDEARLPHPFTAADRRAGYRYAISILQAEFSLTRVLDRPVVGRIF